MKVMYLVGGNSLSPEQGQSYVSKGTLLGCSGGPIFTEHDTIIRCWTAKSDSIPLVIGAHASEGAAPGNPSLEMVNVCRF